MDLNDLHMQANYQMQQMQQTQATNIYGRMRSLESELQMLKQKREEASSELQELTSSKNLHRLAQRPWISWSEYQKTGVWPFARLTALEKQIDQNEKELEELKRVENEQLNSTDVLRDMSPAEMQETLDGYYG